MLMPLGSGSLAPLLAAVVSLLPLAAPPPSVPPSVSSPDRWTAPLEGVLVITDPFSPPPETWLAGHRGVDLRAEVGQVVRAAAEGVVLWAGPIGGRGVVSVLHPDGRRSTYEPLTPDVSLGDEVDRGQVLGRVAVAPTHCGSEPSCLHWGLLRGEVYLDPMSVLRTGRPTLLPLTTTDAP